MKSLGKGSKLFSTFPLEKFKEKCFYGKRFLIVFCTLSEISIVFRRFVFRRCSQNCFQNVQPKILRQNVSLRNYIFLSFLDIDRMHFGRLPKKSARLSKLPSTFPQDHFEEKQLFQKYSTFYSSISEIEQNVFCLQLKSFQKGCQICFLRVRGNRTRKQFFLESISFFHHFWTLSKPFSAFVTNVPAGFQKLHPTGPQEHLLRMEDFSFEKSIFFFINSDLEQKILSLLLKGFGQG